MATVGDLIALALINSGVVAQGQAPSPEDSNNALTLTNIMISQWNRKRWLLYDLLDVAIPTTGAQSYTVGPGGDFNTPRPDRLENGCYLRQLNNTSPQAQTDYPLQIIPSYEDYTRIRLKEMGTWPSMIFYDSNWPMGTVYPWPVPAANLYDLHILVKNQITQFASLTTAINLPPEYYGAIFYNLQTRLRAAYRLPPDDMLVAFARDALNAIRGANIQVPTLQMPRAVVGNQVAYNVYSDNN